MDYAPEAEVPARAVDSVLSSLRTESGRAGALLHGLTLDSHFQPVYSLAHSRTVGFEALMRPSDDRGQTLAPLQAFSRMPGPAARWNTRAGCRSPAPTCRSPTPTSTPPYPSRY